MWRRRPPPPDMWQTGQTAAGNVGRINELVKVSKCQSELWNQRCVEFQPTNVFGGWHSLNYDYRGMIFAVLMRLMKYLFCSSSSTPACDVTRKILLLSKFHHLIKIQSVTLQSSTMSNLSRKSRFDPSNFSDISNETFIETSLAVDFLTDCWVQHAPKFGGCVCVSNKLSQWWKMRKNAPKSKEWLARNCRC